MGVRVTNVNAVLRALQKTVKHDTMKIDEGLTKAAHMILQRSKKFVPVEFGHLLASGRVVTNGKRGMGFNATVEYGGPMAPYALYVHEIPDPPIHHDPPTQYKFLQKAVNLSRGSIVAMMKRQIGAKVTSTYKSGTTTGG